MREGHIFLTRLAITPLHHRQPWGRPWGTHQTITNREITMQKEAKAVIAAFLAAQEPATLEQICWELRTQLGLRTTQVLPIAITAIAALQEKGLICQYDPSIYFGNPLEFAWVLAEQKPEQKPRPGYYLDPAEGWVRSGWPD